MKLRESFTIHYSLLNLLNEQAKALKLGLYEPFRQMPSILPCFQREAILYGKGVWGQQNKIPTSKNLGTRGAYWFTQDMMILDPNLIKLEEFNGTCTQKFLLFKKGEEFRSFYYGLYPGPTARFNTSLLAPDEIYIKGSGNPEVESFLDSLLKDSTSVDVGDLPAKKSPVVFGSYNRESIQNETFSQLYRSMLSDDRDFIGESTLLKTDIPISDLPNTILNETWCVENQLTKKILIDFYGGIFVLDREDKDFESQLKQIARGPFKKIDNLRVKNYPFPEWEYLPLALYVGVESEN